MFERFFPKKEEQYVSELLFKGLTFPDAVEILWEKEKISEKYFETLSISELEILRKRVKGIGLLKIVKAEMIKKGDSGFWAQSCIGNFEDKGYLSFAQVMLKESLLKEKSYGEYYKVFLKAHIERYSNLSPDEKNFITEMETFCLHNMLKGDNGFIDWRNLFNETNAILEQSSWSQKSEEIQRSIRDLEEGFSWKIMNSSLSFDELVWVRNKFPSLNDWAREKLLSTEYE